MSGSLEQFPNLGMGTATETFSNIKTPAAVTRVKSAKLELGRSVAQSSTKTAAAARKMYRPRFLAHLGLLTVTATVIMSNSPVRAHALSLRLATAQAGVGSALDEVGQAAVAADMASVSQLMITSEATKTATAKTSQVALLTSDDTSLAKRQVVQTAGNATRDISSYIVQAGDTISGIAAKFNITSATLTSANNLSSADSIKPGESLTILPVTGLLYTVQSGDNADTLASKYSANAAQITSFNNAEVKGLAVGSKIIIPDGVAPQVAAPSVAAPAPASSLRGNVLAAIAPHLTPFYGGSNGYAMGYCTYYVASRRSIPSNWGNANQWYYNAQASGFAVGSTPAVGAIAWTGAGYYGHVAYVEGVSGSTVTISEMNFNGNWNRVTSRTAPASSFRYIY
jgi:surface antigen